MNKYFLSFLTILLVSIFSFGQSKQEMALRKKFWDTNDEKKNSVIIPEKWNNESAVILFIEEYFEFTNNGKKMYNPSFLHKRIKLLDKAAVESFSEFEYEKDKKVGAGFFNFYKEHSTIGIKIIKEDGTETILDIDSETITHDEENKIAIPGLEIGDILDVFIYEDDYLRSFSGSHSYEPIERVLSSNYPIVFSRLAVEVENDYFLNMESYNGAPEIKEEETDKRVTRRYSLETSDIEKSDFPRWFYPLKELPALKFQVTFALKRTNELRSKVFMADKDAERKASVSKDEIMEYYSSQFDADNKRDVRQVLDYLEDNNITDKREQMVKGLYYIRHMSYNRFIELLVARDNGISTYPEPCDMDYVILNENRFVNYMAGLAKQLKIDYDIIVATPEFNGPIEDLLLRSNVSYGLRFNFDDPLYFFNLSPHVQADYFPMYLEGTKVYKLSVVKDRKIEAVELDYLPTTTSEENTSKESLKVQLSNDFKTFTIDRNLQFSGHFKTEEIDSRIFFGDYLDEEFKHFNTKHFYNCKKKQKKYFADVENKMNAVMKTYKDNVEEKLSERVGSSYDVTVDDYTYSVVSTSRYDNNPLEINDHYTIKDEFVKKAGPNYIVEVGSFIGGQIQIKEDEIERSHNVYLNHAKTFIYEVEINIPEGYEVVGLDKLNKNLSNSTGSFVSVAKIENGTLKFHTKKVYAKRNYTKAEWPEMLPWLKEAYDFSQEKVMFKKK